MKTSNSQTPKPTNAARMLVGNLVAAIMPSLVVLIAMLPASAQDAAANQDLALNQALCDRQWTQAAQLAEAKANQISDPQLKQQWLDYRDRLMAVSTGALNFNTTELEQLGCNVKYNLAGTVVFEKLQANVPSNLVVQPGRQCVVVSGHIDVKEGAPVIIKDSAGNTLITTELGRGSTMPEKYTFENSSMASPVQSINCLFGFNVADLPLASSYSIQVGNRPPQSFSRDLLQQNNWQVEVRVKNPSFINNGGLIY
jgi:hypothetical protein